MQRHDCFRPRLAIELSILTCALGSLLLTAELDGNGKKPTIVAAPSPGIAQDHIPGLVPLDEMTATDRYQGQDGGLYGAGQNRPAKAHLQTAQQELARIGPLNAAGRPAADGKIVLLSVGMSNTSMEFARFKKLADADEARAKAVVLVDGAQGAMTAVSWAGQKPDPRQPDVWKVVEERLKSAGVTAQQVQVLWVKHARKITPQLGRFPAHADELKANIITSLQIARQRFPNLRVAYLSSRTYAGYASISICPEPFAYEGAFAVRWVIQAQINGDKQLNCDPARGEVKAPLLLWGPYLWANGVKPRKSDGLFYKKEDFQKDGVHPTRDKGEPKVADLLLKFFKTDPLACSNCTAAGWPRCTPPPGRRSRPWPEQQEDA
jgi:hypothetical protein